ncbi:hypothetical protein TanjilG_07750 [Lupinus angustifolius]|uniref:Uncharacterized protein n=1 Tax=Lupinus angustifolius TaxID=3871 RepID=A0A1J7GNK2_LUPAN|nr:hypothetical protein TanjilG_07750 [Lupinus angustifolius]
MKMAGGILLNLVNSNNGYACCRIINDSTSKDHDQHGSSMNQKEIGLVGIIAMCHEPDKARNMSDQDRVHQFALSRSGSMHQIRIRQPRSEWMHQVHICQSRSLHQMRIHMRQPRPKWLHQVHMYQSRSLHQMRMGNEHQLALSRSGQALAHQLALPRSGQALAHQLMSQSGKGMEVNNFL